VSPLQESIEILLNVMEGQKEDLIVTLAGYKDRMDKVTDYKGVGAKKMNGLSNELIIEDPRTIWWLG
jgi:hypothetical protein